MKGKPKPVPGGYQITENIVLIGHRKLGCRRRGGGSKIADKIADGKIGLVPNR
ncbi:hypothetical protein SDC9_212806 [bioreactor metagenome]|uniref:Uncharacterized protein n=1 Tax=bioreactor metagenome TaxID=1076179 RepID=A0A645JNV8_9ZZZZ